MAPQELMCLDENADVRREISGGGFLRRAVRLRVVLVFPAEAQAQEDAQAVGIEGEHGKGAREQEDFFGAGVADRGELLQGLDGLFGRTPENAGEVAAVLLERGRRDLVELPTVLPGMIPFPPISWSAAGDAARIRSGFNPVSFFRSRNASAFRESLAR